MSELHLGGGGGDRAYRVCFVTADEAVYLNRTGKNELARCCGHLWCFHNHGRREDGSEWSSCWIQGCHCTTETPPDRLTLLELARDRDYQATERREAAVRWFGLGVSLCGLAWMLVEVLR